MKTIFASLIVISIGLDYGYPQVRKEIPVPILKENKKIDDLIETFLSNDKSRNVFLNNNSCLTISFGRGKNNYHYCIVAIDDKHLVNNDINYLTKSTENYGCFGYKGFEVFVDSDDSLNDFFSKTSSSQTFNYLYISQSVIDPRDRYKVEVYKYENGVFNIAHSNLNR